MDLDFTDEQEMLRETVRGVCEKHASLDRRPRGRGRPDRLPRIVLDAARRPRSARAHDLGAVRRLRHDDARRRGRLRGVRPCARAVAALRQLGAERRRARTGGERRAARRVAAAHRRRRRDPHARVARARIAASDRAACSCTPRPTATGSSCRARSGTCASPQAADALVVLARTGPDDARRSTCSSCRATRRASRSRSRCRSRPTPSSASTSTACGCRRRRASVRPAPAGTTWDATMRDGHRPARRVRDGRRGLRPRDHGAVRQGPAPVRQAARRVPSARALPRRREVHGRRRAHARVGSGVGARQRATRRSARADGEALRDARRSAT